MENRYKQLISELSAHVYEKDTEIGLALLAAMAGESVLLLGPPGVAKSLIARRLKCAFQNASVFEYLMSRFSTPDEIFGPVSISQLRTSDVYERRVEGYLPTAEIVFLDEVWKAGPAIQNSLLTVINEKIYRNGDHEIRLPLKLLIGASNELPTEGEGLEALWDRFLIRIVSGCVKDQQTFIDMLLDAETSDKVNVTNPITRQEYEAAQEIIPQITCSPEVMASIVYLRSQLSVDRDHKRAIYVSDRRWKKILQLLRTSAFIHQRKCVMPSDLFPLWRCLWNEPTEQEEVRGLMKESLFAGFEAEMDELRQAVASDLKLMQVKESVEADRKRNDHRNDGLLLCNHFYYHVLNHGTGNTYIFAVDFRNLPEYNSMNAPTQAILYKDPKCPKNTIIRNYAGHATSSSYEQEKLESEKATIYRKEQFLFINGVRYEIEKSKSPLLSDINVDSLPKPSGRKFYDVMESKVQEITRFSDELQSNMFLSKDDKTELQQMCNVLRKEFAYLRIDIEKLEYGD
ncbi:MAG: AAA family ATPase [Paludibacteraceae bacterium]|nr:AAA family ATPase [Paludibacteraceae bacterium]